MTQLSGDTVHVDGAVNVTTVPDLIDAIEGQLKAGARKVDFAAVNEVDSAAVALALEWRRQAAAHKVSISFAHTPAVMQNLANLYGVSDLIESPAV